MFLSYGGTHGSTLHGDDPPERAIVLEAKAKRDHLFPSGAVPEPTEAEAEADPEYGDTHEADMDEPEDSEPTTAEYRLSTNPSSIRSWPCLDNVWSRLGGQCGWVPVWVGGWSAAVRNHL